MQKITSLSVVTSCLLISFISGCHQVYWQRNKVRVGKRLNQSVKVEINNQVPYVFNTDFNAKLKSTCEKEFTRMGYTLQYKELPDFIATITISMDSFKVEGVYTFHSAGLTSLFRTYKKDNVKAILFNYNMVSTKYKTVKWQENNDIYYFDDSDRNSRRSNNMIKYTIRYGK